MLGPSGRTWSKCHPIELIKSIAAPAGSPEDLELLVQQILDSSHFPLAGNLKGREGYLAKEIFPTDQFLGQVCDV